MPNRVVDVTGAYVVETVKLGDVIHVYNIHDAIHYRSFMMPCMIFIMQEYSIGCQIIVIIDYVFSIDRSFFSFVDGQVVRIVGIGAMLVN